MGSVEKIIHDHLYMEKVSARWIPRLPTPFQKQERVESSQALLTMCRDNQEDLFDTLIIQDKHDTYFSLIYLLQVRSRHTDLTD